MTLTEPRRPITATRGRRIAARRIYCATAAESLPPGIEEMVQLEQRDQRGMTFTERAAHWITEFSGSMPFVYLHALWFGIWIAINLGLVGLPPFDPFPFGLLTMIVSLEAIFLSTFVLLSQNRQALQADRRAKVAMQVNVLAEQEATKIIHMLAEIQDRLGVAHGPDPELDEMKRQTRIADLADAIEAAEAAPPADPDEEPKGTATPR